MSKLGIKVMEYFKTVAKVKRNFFESMSKEEVSSDTATAFKAMATQQQMIHDECDLVQSAMVEAQESDKKGSESPVEMRH